MFKKNIFFIGLFFVIFLDNAMHIPSEITHADRRFCLRFLQESDYEKGFLTLLGQLAPIQLEKITPGQFAERIHKRIELGIQTLVLEDIEKHLLVATATLFIEPKFIHAMGLAGHIEDVVVDARARGLGLGQIIIQAVLTLARQQGCYKIILDCKEPLIAFYAKNGFKQKGAQMAIYFDKLAA